MPTLALLPLPNLPAPPPQTTPTPLVPLSSNLHATPHPVTPIPPLAYRPSKVRARSPASVPRTATAPLPVLSPTAALRAALAGSHTTPPQALVLTREQHQATSTTRVRKADHTARTSPKEALTAVRQTPASVTRLRILEAKTTQAALHCKTCRGLMRRAGTMLAIPRIPKSPVTLAVDTLPWVVTRVRSVHGMAPGIDLAAA